MQYWYMTERLKYCRGLTEYVQHKAQFISWSITGSDNKVQVINKASWNRTCDTAALVCEGPRGVEGLGADCG